MDLITRGRLSVQRVTDKAWAAIQALAEKGGWEEVSFKSARGSAKGKEKAQSKVAKGEAKGKLKTSLKRKKKDAEEEEAEESADTDALSGQQDGESKSADKNPEGKKRKVKELDPEAEAGLRRSTRTRTKK